MTKVFNTFLNSKILEMLLENPINKMNAPTACNDVKDEIEL